MNVRIHGLVVWGKLGLEKKPVFDFLSLEDREPVQVRMVSRDAVQTPLTAVHSGIVS